MALPDAEPLAPACGACGAETTWEDQPICVDCQLMFDPVSLAAEFIDPDVPACGVICDNTWHGDHKIRPGTGYRCGTCQLPTGHDSEHWTDCEPRRSGADLMPDNPCPLTLSDGPYFLTCCLPAGHDGDCWCNNIIDEREED